MLNNRLKEYRERAGLSQTELAWRAKMAAQNISAIERRNNYGKNKNGEKQFQEGKTAGLL